MLFELTGTSSACCTPGTAEPPALATRRAASQQRAALRDAACKVTAEASEAGGDFGRARCAARPLMDALDHRETESKAGLRQPV